MKGLTPFLDDAELRKMLTAKTVGGVPVAGSRCFVGDMTDIFGEWVPDALLDRLFAVFALRPDVTWQILTKRAERMHRYFDTRVTRHIIAAAAKDLPGGKADGWQGKCDNAVCNGPWPLPNVHLGVSCEDQPRADERIPLLLETPAAVRFISAEPLIGPIDLNDLGDCISAIDTDAALGVPLLDWVIVGGESGPSARPCDLAWIRSIVQQCRAAAVPCFVKQLGARITGLNLDGPPFSSPPRREGFLVHWTCRDNNTFGLCDHKGGDMDEWAEDLRVREFPAVRS